jgi:hypothetical protein
MIVNLPVYKSLASLMFKSWTSMFAKLVCEPGKGITISIAIDGSIYVTVRSAHWLDQVAFPEMN